MRYASTGGLAKSEVSECSLSQWETSLRPPDVAHVRMSLGPWHVGSEVNLCIDPDSIFKHFPLPEKEMRIST